MLTLSDIKWAAEECERQNSGEISVYKMCNALDYARNVRLIIDLQDVRILGELIEPEKNKDGFRKVPVHFRYMTIALPPDQIVSSLTSLITHGNTLTPTEWYKEFESIHPFLDGNGRVGAILFNIKNGTLSKPIAPPNVFG